MTKFVIKKEYTDTFEPMYRIYQDKTHIKSCETEERAIEALDEIVKRYKENLKPEIIKEIIV